MNRLNEIYKPVTIGTIELSNALEEFLTEMSPGSLPLSSKIGFCKIEVWPDEGPIPHFHIITKNNIKWECCICIYEAKYFYHGTKTGTLSSKQLKILDKWLREKSKLDTSNIGVTNWDIIRFYWSGQGNPTINVPDNCIQPDYTKTI